MYTLNHGPVWNDNYHRKNVNNVYLHQVVLLIQYFNATCFFCHTFHDSTLQYPEVTKRLQREGSVIGSYLLQNEPVKRFVP